MIGLTYQLINKNETGGMIMISWLKIAGVAAVSFLALDLFWLLVVARKMYQQYLGNLMGQTRFGPAAIFYLIYLLGILFFIINPALEKNSLLYAIAAGGFLGLLCYGTYDLPNLATIANWPIRVNVADLSWGTFVTATVSGITVFVAQHFNWR